jgi:hypothetical protein
MTVAPFWTARHRVLHRDALGVLDLPVVVRGRGEQALGVEARVLLQRLLAREHLVVGDGLVVGEDVVADHAKPDHAGARARNARRSARRT